MPGDAPQKAVTTVQKIEPHLWLAPPCFQPFAGVAEDGALFRSDDGGKNWKKSKYIDPDSGFTDVAIDPSNPKILYAASLQRRRTWWGYNGGGPGSALGRFSRKAQVSSLLQQTVEAYHQDIGITTDFRFEENVNPLASHATAAADRVADPELPASVVRAVIAYVRLLAPPADVL